MTRAGAGACSKSHRAKLHASWSGPKSTSFLASRCEEVCAAVFCPSLHPRPTGAHAGAAVPTGSLPGGQRARLPRAGPLPISG